MERSFSDRAQLLGDARFYGIVDLSYIDEEKAPAAAAAMFAGGVQIIQLRAKHWEAAKLIPVARNVGRKITSGQALFIINDHPAIVAECGADGVHIGQDDEAVDTARAAAGKNMLVGKSSHSLEQAIAAEKEGADYIGVGPLFATPTKPDYVPVGLPLVAAVRAVVKIPQFCIGGIKAENLPQVLAAGARRVVIVSGILQAADIQSYCQLVRRQLDSQPN